MKTMDCPKCGEEQAERIYESVDTGVGAQEFTTGCACPKCEEEFHVCPHCGNWEGVTPHAAFCCEAPGN
jgi:hypothetical protein